MLRPGTNTISLGIDWADTYKPQLEGVRLFLLRKGLKPARIYAIGKTNSVWHLRLTRQSDLLEALTKMVPFLVKKKKQAEAAIRYLRDLITGEELVEEYNEAVRAGTRSGYMRLLRMPYAHYQGVAKAKEGLRLRHRNP
jgi:hypothetical protein